MAYKQKAIKNLIKNLKKMRENHKTMLEMIEKTIKVTDEILN